MQIITAYCENCRGRRGTYLDDRRAARCLTCLHLVRSVEIELDEHDLEAADGPDTTCQREMCE